MKRPSQITNAEEWETSCREVVRVARGILDQSIGVILGARSLARLRFRVRAESDADFLVFVGIDSETDHFPVGDVRRHWNADALAQSDSERERAEKFHQSHADTACRSLIERYGDAGKSQGAAG